jgi:hypothetical protein
MNAIISSLHNFEHFVINHCKFKPIRCSAKNSPTLLILFVFRVIIVRRGKTGITFVVLVAFICDKKVMSTFSVMSIGWAIVEVVYDCVFFLSLSECHFFPEFELQQERTSRRIIDVFTIFISFPLLSCECSDGSVEFSADNCDSVCDIIAVSVECSS